MDILQPLGLKEAYIPNLGLRLCLEPSKKFLVVVMGGSYTKFSVLLWAEALV